MPKHFDLKVDPRFNLDFDEDDDDCLEVSDFELKEIENNKGKKLDGDKQRAKQYLLNFFKNKKMHFGGPILIDKVVVKDNLELVDGLDLPNSIDLAFIMLGIQNKILDDTQEIEEIEPEDDIVEKQREQILTILNQCCKVGIPKSNAGGVLLLCLEFCYGYDIP